VLWLLGLLLLVGAPWIAGIVYYWRKAPREGSTPPSLAEMVRRRLWTS